VHCKPPIRPGKKPQRRDDEKARRRRLFSRWYEGIRVDEEGLYSLTPERLALEMVDGLNGVVLDGTCGVGALAIAAARQAGVRRVIAVDSSRARLDMARHNAGIYGVDDRVDWVHGRLEECLPIQADALLLDPPWGGRGYDRRGVSLGDLAMPVLDILNAFAGPVLLKLPKSFLVSELPGHWRVRPAVDDRGYIKFLVARRGGL
jgi:trimethylguanosine synthase